VKEVKVIIKLNFERIFCSCAFESVGKKNEKKLKVRELKEFEGRLKARIKSGRNF